MENKLFAVMLGGNPPRSGIEVHDVVFTVGPTISATEVQVRAAWFAEGTAPHIDSWMALDVVDGARISVVEAPPGIPSDAGLDLWHVNLGFYEAGETGFFEGHENLFVVATSAAEAKVRAKMLAKCAPVDRLHTDAIHRVSDRLAAAGSPFVVRVVKTNEAGGPVAHDGYQPLSG